MIAIVARSENGVIGKDGGLPWRCKGDLQFFKRTTMGRKIVVGRTTFEGLPPLKGREIFVLTRKPDAGFEGATAVSNPADVPADAIVCGGAAIYDLMIPQCDQLLVTTVKKEVEGDTFFNFQWLEGFEPEETIEETDEYSVVSYRRSGPSS
ncbi:dihydrofolate reductase [Tichowtungia aerotolerans]|uniref:dihydrofolate reductase n=1 Tax=Tichowtungia aerotolerans TaxID=2697043 RepID=A0A6P1M5B1_9BACT|nr:dihydrofolate reductase [Tichowtungia aerotolerans]QHI69770.1 dihydrofolate reductase [Tichowtungia aerotolerans]